MRLPSLRRLAARRARWLAGAWLLAGLLPGIASATSLDFWSFSDTNLLSGLGYAPMSFTNLTASGLGDGNAVVLDSTNAAWLQYRVVETNGAATNLTVDQGSILFWFAPTSWSGTNAGGAGPGDWSRLVEAGCYTTNASYGWFSLYTDPPGVNLYFSAQDNNGSQATFLSAPIFWTTNRWHQVALTYSPTNSALYLDGEIAATGSGVTCHPGADALTNGFFIGSSSSGGAMKAHGMFDDFQTYSYPVDATTVASGFNFYCGCYYLNWFNPANMLSASSLPTTTPTFDVVAGSGYLRAVTTNLVSCSSSSSLWITNVVARSTNSGAMSINFTISGGYDATPYDVFAASAVAPPSAESTPWVWMGQGYHCVSYSLIITSAPPSIFLILGTPQDSDLDGITDAYELLVSKTNPYSADSDNDGIPEAWAVLNGLSPQTAGIASQDPDLDGLSNKQEYLWGTKPLVSEGFSVWINQPQSGLP